MSDMDVFAQFNKRVEETLKVRLQHTLIQAVHLIQPAALQDNLFHCIFTSCVFITSCTGVSSHDALLALFFFPPDFGGLNSADAVHPLQEPAAPAQQGILYIVPVRCEECLAEQEQWTLTRCTGHEVMHNIKTKVT